MLEGKTVGADNEVELEFFNSISFTNALVLKINQLAKQVKKVPILSSLDSGMYLVPFWKSEDAYNYFALYPKKVGGFEHFLLKNGQKVRA